MDIPPTNEQPISRDIILPEHWGPTFGRYLTQEVGTSLTAVTEGLSTIASSDFKTGIQQGSDKLSHLIEAFSQNRVIVRSSNPKDKSPYFFVLEQPQDTTESTPGTYDFTGPDFGIFHRASHHVFNNLLVEFAGNAELQSILMPSPLSKAINDSAKKVVTNFSPILKSPSGIRLIANADNTVRIDTPPVPTLAGAIS